MTRRFGFTLAEVLITLGIIGVVAAMTMPTLINQTNGAQYKAAYKKALSAVAQGITLNVALNDKSFADAADESATTDTAESETVLGYLKARMNVVDVNATGHTITDTNEGTEQAQTGNDIFIYFNDGSMFAFKADGTAECTEENKCEGIIDVNGMKGPNKVVKCTGTYTAATATAPASCTEATPTDVYPVYFYDQTITPKTAAGRTVLYGK